MMLLKRLGIAVLLVVGVPAGCFVGIGRYFFEKQIVTVSEDIPASFPLLAVVEPAIGPPECRVLLYKDLPELQASGSSVSFLVTPAVRPLCDAAVRDPKDFFAAGFHIESEQGGRQALFVEATWDDDWVNRGWYEATHDEFIPAKHQSFFGGGFGIAMAVLGLPTLLVYYVILARVARRGRAA